MTLQELRFMIALAQEKHFGKASNVCFVSQPTLSIAIQKLEKELGVVLFERKKKDVLITPVGQAILERAERVMADIHEIKQLAQSEKDPLKGTFKLGAIYTVGPYLLPPLIQALHKLAPDMPIDIQEDYTHHLRKKLLVGELDAILISLPFSDPGLVTRELYKESFEVLMPIDHPLARLKSIPEKSLSHYPLLMLGEGHCFSDQIMASCPLCFASSSASKRVVESGSLETLRHMVASGMGITILPSSALNYFYYKTILTTRPLKGASPYRVVALAYRATYPRKKVIQMIVNAIKTTSLKREST